MSKDLAPTENNDQTGRTTPKASRDPPSGQRVLLNSGEESTTPIALSSSQQASPKGSENQVCTRSGKLVRPPSHFKNFVIFFFFFDFAFLLVCFDFIAFFFFFSVFFFFGFYYF